MYKSARSHLVYFLTGVGSLFAYPYLAAIPTVRTLVVSGQLLMIVGICLGIHHGWQRHSPRTVWKWGALALLLPLITIVRIGFLGYGIVHLSVVATFLGRHHRLGRRHLGWIVVAVYLLLSVYVTYMRDRGDLRAVVWAGESYSQRTDVTTTMSSNFEWFDPRSNDHLGRIAERLDQNWLVGAALEHMSLGSDSLLVWHNPAGWSSCHDSPHHLARKTDGGRQWGSRDLRDGDCFWSRHECGGRSDIGVIPELWRGGGGSS